MSFTPGDFDRCKVLDIGMKNNCYWVIQEIGEYPKTVDIFGHKAISYKWLVKNVPSMIFRGREIQEYNEKMSRVFWDIDSWNEFYNQENITFAFGTRFHGNMEALRNGIPALWITHDSRTTELTKYLHLPNISISDISKIKNLEELLEYCDYTDLKNNYMSLCEKYVEYLNENGLAHKYSISRNSCK